MKKGIVMEHHRRYTIVMTELGTLQKAKRIDGAEIGSEAIFEPKYEGMVNFFQRLFGRGQVKLVAMVAVLLIAIFPIYSWYDGNQTYAYVNLDINPSIEMKVNENRKVLELIPGNEDAAHIIEVLSNWEKDPVEKVIASIVETSRKEGYLNARNSVLVGISYVDETRKGNFTKQIEDYMDERFSTLSIATFIIPESLRRKAEKSNESVNKIMADSLSDSKKQKVETKKEQVNLDKADKEIIQSFYNEEAPSTNAKEQKWNSPDHFTPENDPKNGNKPDPGNKPEHPGKGKGTEKFNDEHPGKGKGLEKFKDGHPGKGNGIGKEKGNDTPQSSKPSDRQKGEDHSHSRMNKDKNELPVNGKEKGHHPSGKEKKKDHPHGKGKKKDHPHGKGKKNGKHEK
ncbi:anti-sigma factor domain-containing protein [Thalassobacillus pellis]|uniref:anti-sigma-I factor RsgI family protein n=1 Tax=Thalassobacillus pellis TaxID=748008 RepID=UPI001960776F|nr:hypothetical protein [Thalassobacillus pellis]MBM7551186.1 hypothetical protein [Thalassobacillus pellis]